MDLSGCTALVTGASRGLGREFARQLLERGARTVYATARRPEAVDVPGATALRLDVTDPASVAAVTAVAGDVTLVVNNAGVSLAQNLVTGDLDKIRATMDTHFYGTLHVVRAFAPVLAANGGGAVLNVLSVLSWAALDGNNAYAAAKSAQWALTNGVRLELAAQGTLVTGFVLGPTATEEFAANMGDARPVEVNDPAEVVSRALDGVVQGRVEIVADAPSRRAKAALAGDPTPFVIR